MRITWQGHSCFIIEADGKRVIIDPFLNGNPLAKIKPSEIKVDAVLVTHGHSDHLGDAIEISKANKAPVIGTFELVNYCTERGATGHPMHIGGSYTFPFGRVKLTIAHHGSTTDTGPVGNPCGLIVSMGGKTIYHAGDTGLFSDMALIGEINPIDCALLPIGDNFTMGIEDAIRAVGFLKPAAVVPMHYNTFDMIRQDPEIFRKGLAGKPVDVKVMKPGESIDI
ncbi:MAG TPA: metal-dependent hydrolase [Deltaproteobacteria bacterium]|nr:MAG: metal-dependent hydrolase [Deltaproteobacteria bacterium GWA2_55_82]OGQ63258.1 MAG: metal-dependent hydrolase [Deltaproteobacteria bacterium RIFCSPLOWO2_02_FULL_55_12]OIJ73093.1 MAG: metal-dependent hydrolase [Deltaproteobacteria bacterium GWC2_55_46]HBG47856.1 metal-dependent hydrolase [Deltaproteobacteria bacterium]HCY11881.1 metal-dependent hydrolase [Deltaproteobacteria bacterium]